MAEVILHVYDITKSDGYNAVNFGVVQMNRLLKDTIYFGGIFHIAVQVYDNVEWAYGSCEKGSGVFSCPATKNPNYTHREKIVLGRTECSAHKVNQILKDLRDAWPGNKYNMVSRNSKHFCDEFLEKLGVPKLPNWANRFANIGDIAKEAAGTVVKAKDKASKLVFHPVDFAVNMTTVNKNSKAIYSPSEFRFRFDFAVKNFKVAAPVIRSDR
ncbi:deSI-like protein At4g17486 [Solanum stenotomum]|uniref:deSI-like protein At4g17486 n=1 Tax=Solanum stenotomum TaxID=172797 RepID=UPI0020D11383|nr:deSI-like protein At4g17486 [Solanum stenotomum]